MRKKHLPSAILILALFAVVGLVATLAPSIAWPNLARAHSSGAAALTALTVTEGGTAQTFTPAFSSTVYSYTIRVENSVAQITIEGTPDGDGTVAYEDMDGTELTDADENTNGLQVDLPTLGGKRINVVVSHTDSGTTTQQTYTVLVIREGTVDTDQAALMALYNNTGSSNWKNNTNWGSTEPIGRWYGVSTNANGRVIQLSLGENNLAGTLPAELGNFDAMERLYLWGNQLGGSIPDLSVLTNLQALQLDNNQLGGSIPAALGSLTNLTELSLWGNRLSGTIPAALGSLTNLQGLHLDRNQLSGTIPAALGSLTSLTQLHLYNNQLSGTIPAELGSLTNLQELFLERNQLSGSIPAALGSLTNLTTLSLYTNRLSGSIPAELGNLTNLTNLYLFDNRLSGSIPAELGNLTNLKLARFADNALTGCIPVGLRYLVAAGDFTPGVPAQDFLPEDVNGDGDTIDEDDIPGLGLPFCTLESLTLSGITFEPVFSNDTTAYSTSVANDLESTTVTATLNDDDDRVSIMNGTNSYTNGASVPLDVGPNAITIDVTPSDATRKQTYTVQVFRAGTEASDRAALMALYNSTGGPNWTINTNWGTDEFLADWYGINTAGGRVADVDLPANDLSGTIPVELRSLTKLEDLDLSSNQLEGNIPDMSGLPRLEEISLHSNQLNGPIPNFHSLDRLLLLDLGSNQLSGEIPALRGVTSLRTLDLSSNQLSGEIPAELDDLFRLQHLYLNNNRLSGLMTEVVNVYGLQATRFAGNSLTGCVNPKLRYLTSAAVLAPGVPAHDFIAVDANTDGDTADDGDTPGLGLPFCTIVEPHLSGVTIAPVFSNNTTTYTASVRHTIGSSRLTMYLYNSSKDTVSVTKGMDTYTSGTSIEFDVGPNVITIKVTPLDGSLAPPTYTITVTRRPNFQPVFDDGPATTRSITEHTSADSNISTPIRATDDDLGDSLTYTLDDASAEFFSIVSGTGQLQTKAALDYETISSYTVTVSVRDSKDSNGDADEVTDDTITVTILVADTNDAPEFPISETRMRSVNENTPAGRNIGAPIAAIDVDDDTLTYSLDTSNLATFDLDAASGQLRVKAPLHYETGANSYTVTVTAADPYGAADTIPVTITITDVDDTGTVILVSAHPVVDIQLTARLDDPDGNVTGTMWSWARSPNGASSWTTISGETSATYTPVVDDVGNFLRVTASYTDGEGSGKSAQAVSANRVPAAPPGPNTPPAFPLDETGERTVDENTPAGRNIGDPIAATDADHDRLTYSLDAASAKSFNIVSTTGQLQTKAALDFEATPNYIMTVTATDTAGDTNSITGLVIVNNLDELGTVRLSSRQPQVAIPLTATLDDLDNVSRSGTVTWTWAHSPNGASSWTTISGVTSATYTPVAGDVGNFLRATASYPDGEESGKSAQAVSANGVQAAPVGQNDEPEFPSSETRRRNVDENTPPGVHIGDPIAATDAQNDPLTYSLDYVGELYFYIVSTTGQLQTKAALDYETSRFRTDDFFTTITATDPSGADDAITILVTVNNVEEAGTVTLSSTQPIVKARLTATLDDPDEVSDSVTWSWARSPNGSSSWTTISGAITDSYTPVIDDVGNFLRATASYTDGEGSSKSAQVISANGVQPAPVGQNERPEFPTTETGTRNMDENTVAGVNIGDPVAAIDPENDPLTYSLNPFDVASFDIVATTGQLRTKAALDYEATKRDHAHITVTDPYGNYSTLSVTIDFNNVDEPGTVALSSLQPLLSIPLTATYDDPDDVNASLPGTMWSWARSPNGSSSWTTISGAITDSYTPVIDDVGGYLRVTASYTDGEGAGKSAQTISANAVDMPPRSNKPVFKEHPTATRRIARNTPADRNIGAPISATDADNDPLTYSLDGPDRTLFDIDTSSGQLRTRTRLTGFLRTGYSVTVSVSDGKDNLGHQETNPQIDATTEVTINFTATTIGPGVVPTPTSTPGPTATATATPVATIVPSTGGSSSGGGGGGGRSRSRATPTPTPSPTPTATPTPTGPQFSGQIAAEPSVTATVVPEGTTLGVNGGGDLPGGVYVNFPPTAVALPVPVSISVSDEAPSDVTAPSGTTLLPLTINITPATPLILGTPLTIEINPTPEQLAAAGGDLNNLAVGVVTPHGIVVLPTQVLHGRLVVTTDRIAPFVLLAITSSGPVLTQPPMGDASSMGPLLKWTQPPGTTWFQVQVIPFNEDGPGINLVIGDGALVSAAQYQVLGPNFGSADPNYVMLPGMTYLWRVRTTTVTTNPTEADWSAWAVSSFKTPPASSSTITRVAPPYFGEVSTLTPTLTWANSNAAVFYYEVQVSRDFEFGPNAFLYSEYVHGGASTPANSYVVPAAFPLEAGEIYYWRVRPRIQGDGDPLPWSALNVFLAPPG